MIKGQKQTEISFSSYLARRITQNFSSLPVSKLGLALSFILVTFLHSAFLVVITYFSFFLALFFRTALVPLTSVFSIDRLLIGSTAPLGLVITSTLIGLVNRGRNLFWATLCFTPWCSLIRDLSDIFGIIVMIFRRVGDTPLFPRRSSSRHAVTTASISSSLFAVCPNFCFTITLIAIVRIICQQYPEWTLKGSFIHYRLERKGLQQRNWSLQYMSNAVFSTQ